MSENPQPFTTAYATLSFHKKDTISLLNFPDSLHSPFRDLILSSWPPGLESSGPFAQSYQFKLRGSPFGVYRAQHYVGGIRLVRDLLAFLYSRSWVLVAPLLCSRRYTAKDVLIFRQDSSTLPQVEWLALAPTANDKLRIVYDAPGLHHCGSIPDLTLPPTSPEAQTITPPQSANPQSPLTALLTTLKIALSTPPLDYFSSGSWSHDSFEIELKGKPWRSRGEDSVKKRIMLARLLEAMEGGLGWRLYAAVVQRTGTDEWRVLDTWYFVREGRPADGESR